mgnify:CR=1 FL=1
MKIASWNVNSIKARLPRVTEWLSEFQPDVVLFQELKCIDDNFPRMEIEDLGYNVATHGQKTYNGVAILSKYPIEDVMEGLPGDDDDEQARYLEATVNNVRVASIYLPNGNPAPGPKYDYKLEWMRKLKSHLKETLLNEEIFIILGDFNVIPEEEDVHNPEAWKDDALFKIETKKAYREILSLGFLDSFRQFNNEPGNYTFWDYQRGAWQRNNGIRIDHILTSPLAADKMKNVYIDKTVRDKDKPSDHVPILIEIE